jgi:hypothetical protein
LGKGLVGAAGQVKRFTSAIATPRDLLMVRAAFRRGLRLASEKLETFGDHLKEVGDSARKLAVAGIAGAGFALHSIVDPENWATS